MACPDDNYFKKVKTASGLVPTHPYNLVPNEFAYGEWDELNLSLGFDLHAAFKNYTSSKPIEAWTPEQTATWETLRDQLYELDLKYEALPGPRGIFVAGLDLPAKLEAQVQLATDYACLLQRIDEETVALGGKPFGSLGNPPPPECGTMCLIERALWITGLLGGAAIAVYGIRGFQNRKGST
jgi:hypothetical protein